MPTMDEMDLADPKVRCLIIGPSKVGKTEWARMAAEAGFKLLYIDGDDSYSTLKKATPQAKPRIHYMDAMGTLQNPRMNRVTEKLLKEGKCIWNDARQRFWEPTMEEPTPPAEDPFWEIQLAKLDTSWVLVVDSWTVLCWSILWEHGIDNSYDVGEMEKASRGAYASIGNKATWFQNLLVAVPCHLIVTAHPDEFVKYKKEEGKAAKDVKEIEQIIEMVRSIPKSTSRPHGLTLPKSFQDVLWMEIDKGGTRMIDATVHADSEGGGAWMSRRSATEYSFTNLAKEIGAKPPRPDSDSPGLIKYAPGEYAAAVAERRNRILDAQNAKPSSLADLVGANK